MKIVAHRTANPTPRREWDWVAVDGDTYDGPGSPAGYGETPYAAIVDLMEELHSVTVRDFVRVFCGEQR